MLCNYANFASPIYLSIGIRDTLSVCGSQVKKTGSFSISVFFGANS